MFFFFLFFFSVRDYWILSTDYTNFAVIYTCHTISENSTCDPEAEEVWVLSRTPTLDRSYLSHINNIVESACMEPEELVDNLGTVFLFLQFNVF